ncbi:MAG: DUF2911 domain-containing protein [Saprospiraceae bacterium]|nr:DUF2911 domain-containing protein [Saprospiraceae bacterium]
MKSYVLTVLLLLATCTLGLSQIQTPAPSPGAKFTQDVGLIKVDVEYSRPSKKGRVIFGDLVPYGDMWRTGANASTKVTFSDKVTVGGKDLDKGTYALYTIPGQKEWTIIFYSNTSYWGTPEEKDFKEEEVAARFTVPAYKMENVSVETFTIGMDNLKNDGAELYLLWESTYVGIPIKVDTDSKVMAAIKSTMAGPKSGDYFAAARYYHEQGQDQKQALEWVNKCLEMGGDKFWILRLKANIQAELGMYKDAIATAQKSTELAKADGNADYPRMNEKSITAWKAKMK